MRKNKFIDLELGAKLKKFTMYFSVFAITFGVVSAIINTGKTYAVSSTSCPVGYEYVDGTDKCRSIATYATYEECTASINEEGLTFTEGNNDGNYCSGGAGVFLSYIDLDNVVTITYDLDGGTLYGNKDTYIATYFINTSIYLPEPEKEGYNFQNWQETVGASINGYNAGQLITLNSSKYLAATWNPRSYNIFDPNDGEWTSYTPKTGQQTIYYDETLELDDPRLDISRDGYELCGWWYKEIDSGVEVYDHVHKQNSGETYYAKWCDVSTTEFVSITFDKTEGNWVHGGTDGNRIVEFPEDEAHYFATSTLLETIRVERDGFNFVGWKRSSDNKIITEYVDYNEDGLILYAVWEESSGDPVTPPATDKTVTATLYPQNGSGNITRTCTISSGANSCEVSLPSVTKTNHTFNGWSKNQSCTGTIVTGSDDISENTNYYACYKENTPVDPGDTPSGGDDNPDINENPNTGNWLLYVAYLVGVLALGYTGYYSYKMVKVKNND